MVHILNYYFTTARKDRYVLMCSIEDHGRMYPTENYDASSGGGRLLSYESTADLLLSISLTLKFIFSWIQSFNTNYLQLTTMYCEKISELFRNIPVTIP